MDWISNAFILWIGASLAFGVAWVFLIELFRFGAIKHAFIMISEFLRGLRLAFGFFLDAVGWNRMSVQRKTLVVIVGVILAQIISDQFITFRLHRLDTSLTQATQRIEELNRIVDRQDRTLSVLALHTNPPDSLLHLYGFPGRDSSTVAAGRRSRDK